MTVPATSSEHEPAEDREDRVRSGDVEVHLAAERGRGPAEVREPGHPDDDADGHHGADGELASRRVRPRPQPPGPGDQAGHHADDGRDDGECGGRPVLERRRQDEGPEQVRERPGQRAGDRSRQGGDEDRADAVEVDRDLQRVGDRRAEDDVDRDRDRHEDEHARVELRRDRGQGARLRVLDRGIDDEGRDEGDRADERERVRALRVEEAVGIDAGVEVADADDDGDRDDDEECDEGSDPANDHGMGPPPVLGGLSCTGR